RARGRIAHHRAPTLGELDVSRRAQIFQPPTFLRQHAIGNAGGIAQRAQFEREGGELGTPQADADALPAPIRRTRYVAVYCSGSGRHSSTAIITSVDLTIALTLAPFLRPRLLTELSVITETISSPPASRTTTSAVTTPFFTL